MEGLRFGAVYKPASSELTVRVMPVAVSRIETMAPGITAPDASLMVPESVAPATCAQAAPGKRLVIAKMTKTEHVVVILFKGTMSSMDVPSRRSEDPERVYTLGLI